MSLIELPQWQANVAIYQNDLRQFAIDVLGKDIPLSQQLILADMSKKGSRTNIEFEGDEQHNRLVIITALWHLCFSPHSVTLFVSPRPEYFIHKLWKDLPLYLEKMFCSPLYWLVEHIVVHHDGISIKGHKNTWRVLTKNVNRPEDLLGLHNENLLIWVDQARSLDPNTVNMLMASLIHRANRAVMSQLSMRRIQERIIQERRYLPEDAFLQNCIN